MYSWALKCHFYAIWKVSIWKSDLKMFGIGNVTFSVILVKLEKYIWYFHLIPLFYYTHTHDYLAEIFLLSFIKDHKRL